MKVYTYSQARQKLAKLLDEARQEGQFKLNGGTARCLLSRRLKKQSLRLTSLV